MKVFSCHFFMFSVLLCSIASNNELFAVVHLTQSDFDSGTYRIKTSDTYILDEDIEFNPIPADEATRTDKPIAGWFAAITVEVDNVVIDLNGKTLQAAQVFLDNRIFSAFADIELDNSPFPGVTFGLIGASFIGDTEFVWTNSSEVKNGTVGRSSHWGIHGNNNANMNIHDVHVKDFAIAGIQMGAQKDTYIHDIKITGLESIIGVSSMKSAADTLIEYLAELAFSGFPGAEAQLAELVPYVEANPQIFNTTSAIPQTTFYGMIFTSGFTEIVPFPMTPFGCAFAAALAEGRPTENLRVENIQIKGLTAAPEEFVLIGSPLQQMFAFNGVAFNFALLGLPVFGCGRWIDAFDANGNFAPTPFLRSQIFVVNSQIILNPQATGALAPNYPAIAASILAQDEAAFLREAMPVFGTLLSGSIIKGVFGIRSDCTINASFKNIKICDVHNVGASGTELAEIPAGQYYIDQGFQQVRYAGNDVWGFEFASNEGTRVTCAFAANVFSDHGDSFGIHLAGNDLHMQVKKSTVSHIAARGDDTHSVVNPPSVAYGFIVEGDSKHINFKKCDAYRIKAPRFAIGFAAEDSEHVAMEYCKVAKVKATSSRDLSSPKEAFGFEVEGSKHTFLGHPCVQDVSINNEEQAKHSVSVAAGIVVNKQSAFTDIHCPKISDIYGGAGKAYKILDEGLRTKVRCPIECSC